MFEFIDRAINTILAFPTEVDDDTRIDAWLIVTMKATESSGLLYLLIPQVTTDASIYSFIHSNSLFKEHLLLAEKNKWSKIKEFQFRKAIPVASSDNENSLYLRLSPSGRSRFLSLVKCALARGVKKSCSTQGFAIAHRQLSIFFNFLFLSTLSLFFRLNAAIVVRRYLSYQKRGASAFLRLSTFFTLLCCYTSLTAYLCSFCLHFSSFVLYIAF